MWFAQYFDPSSELPDFGCLSVRPDLAARNQRLLDGMKKKKKKKRDAVSRSLMSWTKPSKGRALKYLQKLAPSGHGKDSRRTAGGASALGE